MPPASSSRRTFLGQAALLALAGASGSAHARVIAAPAYRFGMVTYLWGRDLSLPDLLQVCGASGVEGVELRTTHAHGVEPALGPAARAEIRARFADSPVVLAGLGSNERFDSPRAEIRARAMEATRGFLQLSSDLGSTGVKVKPDSFHDGVPHEETIEHIAGSLRALGPMASDLGQEIRVEVHGQCGASAETMQAIALQADHPAVRLCWNSNPTDLAPPGIESNFTRLRPWFGHTLHVRELDSVSYPWTHLFSLLNASGYDGWVLLEAHSPPPRKREAAIRSQHQLFITHAGQGSTDEEPKTTPQGS